MSTKTFICILYLGVLFSSHFAFGQFSIGTQVRPRGEFRNGFKTLTEENRDPAFFIEQRSRFYAQYQGESFEMKVNFQDVRIWGATDQIYKTDPSLTNIFEAWGRYHFNDYWSLKIGRMALDYNNARFLGDLNWAAQGRSHDVALASYKNDSSGFQLDVGAAFNQNGFEPTKLFETDYLGVNNYKFIQFAWLHKTMPNGDISLLVHNDGRQVQADTSVAMRQTYGLIGKRHLGLFEVGGEFYYQSGKNASNTNVNAFLLAAYATLKTKLTPVTLGFDYLSGSDINDTEDQAFAPLYGTNHKFYGLMDYFYVGNTHGQGGNVTGLFDVYLKTKFKTGKSSALMAHAHLFNSAAELFNETDPAQTESRYLGTEIDLVYNLKLNEHIKLNLGYSQMFAGESMELIKATPGDHQAFNNWVWFMIDFNPSAVLNHL